MKIKKNDDTLQVKLPTKLKKEAEAKAAGEGKSLSELVREKLMEYMEGK